MARKNLLVTGATGYIGGTTLTMLLERSEPWLHDIEISGLVRNESDAQVLREQGANAIVCSGFEDEGRLQAVAEEFDIIIHAGGGGHIGAAVTLIKGLSARRTKLGNPVHYFHVTGASNISDRPQTQGYVETRTLSDREGIYHYLKYRESIEKWIQRTADIVIAETGQQLNVPTYIAMAPTIFGIGSGKFKRYTTQLPAMIKNMLDTGSCLVLGDGKTQWGRVHVEDIGTFLMCLCRNVLQGKKIPSGDQGIYFVETGRFTHREFSQRLADVGYKMGFVSSPTVTEASLDEVAKRFTNGNRLIAELSYGANSLMKSELGPLLGWVPKYTDDDWVNSFEIELRGYLRDRPALIQMPQWLDVQKPDRFEFE